MSKNNLADFFKQKQDRAASQPANIADRQREFLKHVDSLFTTIEGLLQDIPTKPKREPTTVVESDVGEYEAEKLVLTAGTDERVEFVPKGFRVIGASGRVDVQGDRGEGMLILQPGERWGVVVSTRPTLRVVPLEEDSLLGLLRDVMRP